MLQLPSFTLQRPTLPRRTLPWKSLSPALWKGTPAPFSLHYSPSTKDHVTSPAMHPIDVKMKNNNEFRATMDNDLLPNALRRKGNPSWRGGFSLGIDLGSSRTGIALSKGFSPRPLTVLELRGQKLELRLLEMAEKGEADEFIIGLPISFDGKETSQSNKVRSIAGRLAVRAAERGWRVYLQDEHGTSAEALDFMIDKGFSKPARQGRIDAYAAVMVLERYFATFGQGTELVLPKQLELQEKLRKGPPKDLDFFPADEHFER